MSRELLASPALLFELLDDASLHWFLCHPTSLPATATASSEAWIMTEWLSTFSVFTLGSYVANKLEQLLWKGYVASLPSTPSAGLITSAASTDGTDSHCCDSDCVAWGYDVVY